jgi:competence protein ComGD
MPHRRAFTLLELVVVMAIVLVMSAVAMPGLGNTIVERTIYDAGVQLLQDMRLVQQYSITQRSLDLTYWISFDLANAAYTVVTPTKSVTKRLPSSLTMSLRGFSSPLSFNSMGQPCEGSTATKLANDCYVLIGNSEGTKQVKVLVGVAIGRITVAWTAR